MRGFRYNFFSVLDCRVGDMMWNLFYRGQQKSEIDIMKYHEMKFYNECHEAMVKAVKDITEK